MTVLSKLRTRKLRTFVRPETNQTRVVRNHKCLVVQLEGIESLRFRLDEKDLLPLGVLVDELCYVASIMDVLGDTLDNVDRGCVYQR